MLVSKLHSGTSKTMQLVTVHLDLPLFWKLLTSMCDFVPRDRIVKKTKIVWRADKIMAKYIATTTFFALHYKFYKYQ